MEKLQLSEHFYSLQGEPLSFGKPAYFLRFAGCNLACVFCDTKYALTNKKLITLSFDQLLKNLVSYNCKLIVITGGEPLLRVGKIAELYYYLPEEYTFEIETNGTQPPIIFASNKIRVVRYNVSPKLGSSKNSLQLRYKPEILREFLKHPSIFKFVVQTQSDFNEVNEIVREVGIPEEKVWIMPEGVTDKNVKKHALKFLEDIKNKKYNLTPRLQIWLWGKKKGV